MPEMTLRNEITSPNLGCIRATRSCKRQRRCTACPMKVFESLTGTGRPPTIPILGSLKGAHRFSIAKASGMTSAPISTTTSNNNHLFNTDRWTCLLKNGLKGTSNISFFVIGHDTNATTDISLKLYYRLLKLFQRYVIHNICCH